MVQETGSSAGVLLINPVYLTAPLNNSSNNPSALETHKIPFGFAVGIFRIEQMLSSYFSENLSSTINFSLEDLDAPEDNRNLYLFGKKPQLQLQAFVWTYDIPVGGRTWHLSVYPTLEFFVVNRSLLAWMILAAGVLLASLIQAFLLAMTGRAAMVQRQVAEARAA